MPAIRRVSTGSSPLTRGKQLRGGRREGLDGLIPAHAGKTSNEVIGSPVFRAHPRSRGENCDHEARFHRSLGSSPLTRGKLRLGHDGRAGRGLIPAHAGKTSMSSWISMVSPAHPRSRGENRKSRIVCFTRSGSSPLTRGKLFRVLDGEYAFGLIPAHAGKTRCARGCWRR